MSNCFLIFNEKEHEIKEILTKNDAEFTIKLCEYEEEQKLHQKQCTVLMPYYNCLYLYIEGHVTIVSYCIHFRRKHLKNCFAFRNENITIPFEMFAEIKNLSIAEAY